LYWQLVLPCKSWQAVILWNRHSFHIQIIVVLPTCHSTLSSFSVWAMIAIISCCRRAATVTGLTRFTQTGSRLCVATMHHQWRKILMTYRIVARFCGSILTGLIDSTCQAVTSVRRFIGNEEHHNTEPSPTFYVTYRHTSPSPLSSFECNIIYGRPLEMWVLIILILYGPARCCIKRRPTNFMSKLNSNF